MRAASRQEVGSRGGAAATGGAAAAKARRQTLILDLVASHLIDTQTALAERLRAEGLRVTQATISRDIRELRLVKVPTGDGRYRYAPSPRSDLAVLDERILRLFRECVVSWDASENLVVVNTLPGTATGVAEALDRLHAPEVIGTLAGERTVFVVVKPRQAVPGFLERMRRLVRSASGSGPV